jgi:two-component system, OmpR family, response regulator
MDTSTIRILMVEDDGTIAHLIAIAMQTLDVPHHLDQAFSAEEALTLWHKQPYDLLLTDYNLRGMNGLALVETLKQEGFTTPMVLFTAYDTPRIRKEAQRLGVSAFISKPFFLDEFVNTARAFLPTKTSPTSEEVGG